MIDLERFQKDLDTLKSDVTTLKSQYAEFYHLMTDFDHKKKKRNLNPKGKTFEDKFRAYKKAKQQDSA